MPNSPNAAKAARQAEKNRLRNRAARTSLRTVVRKARDAATGADAQVAVDSFKLATKRIDQAASKKTIHKNKAARLKSRLAKALNAAKKA